MKTVDNVLVGDDLVADKYCFVHIVESLPLHKYNKKNYRKRLTINQRQIARYRSSKKIVVVGTLWRSKNLKRNILVIPSVTFDTAFLTG